MVSKLKLEMKVHGDDLFKAMKNSEYMKKRGYKILYATTFYEQKQEKKNVNGIEIEETVKGDKPIEHRLCYKHTKELIYLHMFDLKTRMISGFTYLVAMGDEKKVLSDIVNLTKEIKKELGSKKKKDKKV